MRFNNYNDSQQACFMLTCSPNSCFLPVRKRSVELCKRELFSGFLFATAKVAYLTAKIFIHIILYSAIHIYWFSYIHNFIIILSRVYKDPIQWPATSWLVSLIGRALHRYRRGQGFESRTSLVFFSGFLFATAKVAYSTAMIFILIILHSAVHKYDFHIFITSE